MKTVYFDTTVYNRILDDPRQSFIAEAVRMASTRKTSEALFSMNNWDEFCSTPDVDRRTQLFKLAYSICKHQFIVSGGELIRRELNSYLGNGTLLKDNIYDKTDFEDAFSKAINGALFQGAPNTLLKEMKKLKHDDLKFEKNSKRELAPLFEGHRNIPFNKFYRSSSRDEKAREWLRRRCIEAFGDTRRGKQDFSDLDLQRLPGLRCLFKYQCARLFRQLLMEEKPRWGSRMDMYHSVFLGYCDIFFTGDNNFLDIVNLFGESKVKCLSFSEFVAQYIDPTI